MNDLDVDEIYGKYESAECEPKENLLNSDNLIPSIFLWKVEKPENAVMLKEVAEVSLGCQYTSTKFKLAEKGDKTGYKIITPKEINDGIIDWDNLQSVHYDGTKFDKYALRKGDIVMTSKTSKIKFAVVDRDLEEKILVTGGMTFIRPNLEKINPYMIQIYFDSQDGRNALAKIQKGNVVVTIIPKNLEEVYIPLPSMEEQKEITGPYEEMISKLAFYNKEIFRIKKEIENYDWKKK